MQNCWEVKKCGRQPGGLKSRELGVCPAAADSNLSGRNEGKYAGRYCWKIAGTLCGGVVQGTYATKLKNCVSCEFYKMVKVEQGNTFTP
jgi:hypothetical protein